MTTPDVQGGGHVFTNPWRPAPRQIACRRCRARKKKCDKKRPVCSECAKSGADPDAQKLQHHARPADKACFQSGSLDKVQLSTAYSCIAHSYVHALEGHVAVLEARLRKSHPGLALDHLSPVSRRASLLSSLPIEDPVEDATYEGMDYADALDGRLGFGDADLSQCMQTPIDEEAAMPVNFDAAETMDDSMDGLGDQVPESAPAQDLLGDRRAEALIEQSPVASSSALADRHLSISVGSRYASEYFSNAHPMWPFLHQKQWDDCWRRWESPAGGSKRVAWMDFFVDMVLSIGALLVQNSGPALEHLESFKFLKDRALKTYDSGAAQGWPALVRTQSSLLLTIQAMHLDSVSTLRDRASEAIKQCTITKLQSPTNQTRHDSSNDIEYQIQRRTTRCCYTIDVLISSSTNQAVSADRFLEDNLLDHDDDVGDGSSPGTPSTPRRLDHEDHMFQLRRIQYRILKMVQKLRAKANRDHHPVPNLWRSQVRHDLGRWIDDIATFSGPEGVPDRFSSQQWLLKLANYATISLFPNPHLAVRSGDARYLVTAACQVLTTFRRFRVQEHLSCYTWTALVHQFQAGVTLVYCLWATPTHQQSALYDRRQVCQALFACLATLVDYANKWASASVFQSIFSLLTEGVPVSEYGDPTQDWALSPDSCAELLKFSVELERLQIQNNVVSILRHMAQGLRPCYMAPSIEETPWIQYISPD